MANKKINTSALTIIVMFFLLLSYSKVNAVDTVIKVAFQPDLPPYQFIEKGQAAGLHIDILNDIAGRNNFIIEYIPMGTTTQCMKALEEDKVDIVLGVMSKNASEYRAKLIEGISQCSVCMIATNEKAEKIRNNIGSEYLAVVFENNTIDYLYSRNMKNLRSIVVSNQVRAFDILLSEEVDAMIGIKNSLAYQINKAGLEDKYTIVNNFMGSIEYSIAVRLADKELERTLNEEFQRLRLSGRYEALYKKWIEENDNVISETAVKIIKLVGVALVAALAIIILNLRINVLLKKQVSEKTKELKKANEDLNRQINETRNSSEVKNRIVEDNPNGIVVFDLDYIITHFNPSASILTGVYPAPIGVNVFEIGLLRDILLDKKEKLFLKGLEFIYKDITIYSKDVEPSTYRYDIYHLFDFDGEIRGAILSVKDITIIRKSKEQFMEREKNRVLNQIVAGISHEIRNPLMAIKTFVELIPIKKGNPQFLTQMAEYLPRELERINILTKNLIDYAKPQSKNKEEISVNHIINSCMVLTDSVVNKKNVTIEVLVNDGLVITADQNQLKQVLMNIIFNGLEAMNKRIESDCGMGEKLLMSLKAWGDEHNIFIQVIDEGAGMNEEEIKKSTEPFFTTKPKGTGLGLAISKQYVEENEGTMTIESKKNEFTRITLKFAR